MIASLAAGRSEDDGYQHDEHRRPAPHDRPLTRGARPGGHRAQHHRGG
jgi:hypothetical protein